VGIAFKQAGIDDLRIHELRRTPGSRQDAMGASIPIFGKIVAHRKVSTSAISAR
jgi:hypothetical protein